MSVCDGCCGCPAAADVLATLHPAAMGFKGNVIIMETLSESDRERFSRHLRLPGFGAEHQQRLKQASVLLIGVGGLGSPSALYLAAAGVGTIGIAEFDRIERHNLQRQVLFEDASVGLSKAEVARERLLSLYPDIQVQLHREGLQPANALQVVSGYDVVVDGSDNFGTRYLVNDASFLAGVPLVSGSVFQTEGQVMVLNAGHASPCYRCLFPEPPEPGTVPGCNEAGVVGALCGVVGSLQAMEVIKLITGLGQSLAGSILKLDVFGNRFATIRLPKDANCPLCSKTSRIQDLHSETYWVPCGHDMNTTSEPASTDLPIEVDVVRAKTLCDEGLACFLDIREPEEASICQIEGSQFIPMGNIPAQLASLPRDRALVVYCHHGFRSLQVVQFLRSRGLQSCTSMKGGIEAWAERWEPGMERY